VEEIIGIFSSDFWSCEEIDRRRSKGIPLPKRSPIFTHPFRRCTLAKCKLSDRARYISLKNKDKW
jgi:hypothetical protein